MASFPVLMYHNVSPNENQSTGLTISMQRFEEQLKYLKEKNYHCVFASELLNPSIINQKIVLITFDDVTENQLLYALPLLEKYQCKATFYIPFAYVGKTDEWNNGSEKIMTTVQLKSLNSEWIEFGHHSFYHQKYAQLSAEEIQNDFDLSRTFIEQNQIKVFPTLAYPYGNFPKKGKEKAIFDQLLQKNGIQLAFRIGNRRNKWPLKNPYQIKRIDVKGEDSLAIFKWKLRWGKLRLF